jgi:ribonuclease T2
MLRALLALMLLFPISARAQDVAGEFDYYVLSLSWSPNWCALEGDGRDSPQCDDGTGFGWVLHGLWPQYEDGWPQDCRTRFASPSRAETGAMADIMGTSGLAWHQWSKHGVCSGLPAADYFALARLAYGRVVRPEVFMRLPEGVALPARVVEEAFVRDNPGLRPDAITVTCKAGMIQEARICLTRDLEFRRCGADVIRDCTLEDALLDPVR